MSLLGLTACVSAVSVKSSIYILLKKLVENHTFYKKKIQEEILVFSSFRPPVAFQLKETPYYESPNPHHNTSPPPVAHLLPVFHFIHLFGKHLVGFLHAVMRLFIAFFSLVFKAKGAIKKNLL